jgi:hypothetical protein
MLGGYLGGVGYAKILTKIMDEFPRMLRSNAEQNATNNKTQLLSNPLFTTISGGTLGSGVTILAGQSGAYASAGVPAGWTVSRQSGGTGTATATIAVAANPDGPGNEVILNCTFNGANDGFQFKQDVASSADWDFGTVVEGMSNVAVDANASGLSGVYEYVQSAFAGGAQQMTVMDNWARGEVGQPGGYKLDMLTQPLTVPSNLGAKAWLTKHIKILASGAGQATVRIRTAGLRKRRAA